MRLRPRRRRLLRSCVPPVLVTVLACKWDHPASPTRDGPAVEGVSSAFYFLGGTGAAYLPVGDTATLRASAYSPPWPDTLVYDSYRSAAEARRFRWTSSDPRVATIGPTGLVTALSPGTTVLGAYLDGAARGGGPLLTVYPAAASIAVEPAAGRGDAEVGDVLAFRLTARDSSGRPLTGVPITLSSSAFPVMGPIPNLALTPSPGVQTFGAWRAGVVTLTAATPHPRPNGRLADSLTVTVRDPGVAPDTLPRQTSDPVLRASAGRTTLRRGDTTTVRLTLTNRGDAPIRLTASASCALSFTLVEGGGTIAWPLGARGCTSPATFVIPRGDSLVRETRWRADDGREPATPLTPGIYWIFPVTTGDGYFAVGETLRIRVLP